uniref:BEACH domain-containing protein B isoform X1 n=1 Tax=Rhizophora mucronata TaxID=61149 RepID=A0A2P2MSN6_RHIMU
MYNTLLIIAAFNWLKALAIQRILRNGDLFPTRFSIIVTSFRAPLISYFVNSFQQKLLHLYRNMAHKTNFTFTNRRGVLSARDSGSRMTQLFIKMIIFP